MRGEFIDVGGSRLYCYAAGSRGVGEPVVFLHGFPASSHLWHDVVRQMPAGHRLVVLDLLGYGRSDRPGTGLAGVSVLAHANRLRLLLDDLGIDAACVVGHGLGGAVALALALDAPARVTRLGLVSCVAFDAWPRGAARLARALAAAPALARAAGVPVLAGLVHGSMLRGFADRERGRHALDQFLHAFTARLGVEVLVAQLSAMRDAAVPALSARLAELSCPTAVIAGADDPFLPVRVSERLSAAIAGATLEVIPEVRHFVPDDAPDRVAAIVGELLSRTMSRQ